MNEETSTKETKYGTAAQLLCPCPMTSCINPFQSSPVEQRKVRRSDEPIVQKFQSSLRYTPDCKHVY